MQSSFYWPLGLEPGNSTEELFEILLENNDCSKTFEIKFKETGKT